MLNNSCIQLPGHILIPRLVLAYYIMSSIHMKLGGNAIDPRRLGVGSASTLSTPYQLHWSSSYSTTSTTSFSESSFWKTPACSKNEADLPSSFFFSSSGDSKEEREIVDGDDDKMMRYWMTQ